MEQAPLILIVEDEPKLSALLRDYLQASAYRVAILDNGNLVADFLKNQNPALILLDLMLPGKDGLSVCREIRSNHSTPVIMLTAKIEEIDRLLGLEMGADDYICKPFSPREVVARVKAVLRRTQLASDVSINSPLQLDEEKMQARINGRRIELTPVEFRLLRALSARPGHVLSRAKLIDVLYNDHRIVSDRTVDSHIKNLRKKISEANQGEDPVTSVYGLGYALDWNNASEN